MNGWYLAPARGRKLHLAIWMPLAEQDPDLPWLQGYSVPLCGDSHFSRDTWTYAGPHAENWPRQYRWPLCTVCAKRVNQLLSDASAASHIPLSVQPSLAIR